jgi:predicted dinucleotide-binding enzyme
MNIGILGSGDVGRRLGDGFIELGHKVKIGSRDPNKSDIAQWVSSHGTNEGKHHLEHSQKQLHLRSWQYLLLLGMEYLTP